ncbi:MAG: hypothetical protein KBT00_01150 [Bacteroidales bacterium]|nr:hypothetical protein [Candidatus Cacconaster merdequi]
MKRLTLLFALLAFSATAMAQDVDFITELPDNFSELDTLPRPRQYKSIHMVGVQYSYNISGVRTNPEFETGYLFTAKNVAVLYTYYHALWDEMFNFGIQAGAKLGEEGYTASKPGYGERCRIVEVPLISQFKIDFSSFRILANLGPYAGYRLSTDKQGGFDRFDQRFDYGAIGGVGLGIVFKPFELHIEGNYKFSLSSMYHTYKNSDLYWQFVYPSNIMISAGLFVHLW